MAIASIAPGKYRSEKLPARPGKTLRAIACCSLLLVTAGQSGCANRAYNDLYIENMAAEIRELEDQLYEYDHEYRLVEQELDSVLSENERLRQQLETVEKPAQDQKALGSQQPGPSRRPVEPEPALPSIMEGGNGGTRNSDAKSNLLPDKFPEPPSQNLQPGGRNAPPASDSPFPRNDLPAPSEIPNADDFDPDLLVPPTITPGEIMPPQPTTDNTASTPSGEAGDSTGLGRLVLSDSRIEIPAQLASRRGTPGEQSAGTTASAVRSKSPINAWSS